MKPVIDHIVVGAAHLDEGCAFIEETCGVTVPFGGIHEQFSTHNCLMQVGQERYFEIIAANPDAPAIDRPRWFSLDDALTMRRLAVGPIALCWVVGVPDIQAVIDKSPIPLGMPLSLYRGDLQWKLTVPDDGHLPESGLVPAFIEWPDGVNPSSRMPALGVTLDRLCLPHPEPQWLEDVFGTLDIEHLADITGGKRSISFACDTPKGKVLLR